ncbi:hypothetical protein TVAG_080140 [Trichomonas vaginalis G3]|uniref:Uncharacterized protein n=1 Tax=Trichomonas vaginalis (strain ATCC PRA-98 / G3) TaxID=412133 RepID=A2FBG7_TRIV3|nr:hypothetical protein TVAGG3_1006520 [Trichomonas vaginalis G3]EAX97754.1 hypothetical protein TVAG_080140 [Trichomonas vaginalis G3]KAI5491171.1 hypothetical protein TVAGG3_1006520 [Trichomonas vaginalis G3]|eukprot:XP_001310684.1 hypothetical protein [Trichomonas vaginalis G3]
MSQNPNMMGGMNPMGHMPNAISTPNLQQFQGQQIQQGAMMQQMSPQMPTQMPPQYPQMGQQIPPQIQQQMHQQQGNQAINQLKLQQMQQQQQQQRQMQQQIPNSASTPQMNPNMYRGQIPPNMMPRPQMPPTPQMYPQNPPPQYPQPEKPPKQKKEELDFKPFPTEAWLNSQKELDLRAITRLMERANKTGMNITFDEECTRAIVQALKIYMQNYLRLLVVYSKRRRNDPIYGEKTYTNVPLSKLALLQVEREIIDNRYQLRDSDQLLPCLKSDFIQAIASRKPPAEREDFINKFHNQDNDQVMTPIQQIENLPKITPENQITTSDVLFAVEQLKSTSYQTLTDLQYQVELMKRGNRN